MIFMMDTWSGGLRRQGPVCRTVDSQSVSGQMKPFPHQVEDEHPDRLAYENHALAEGRRQNHRCGPLSILRRRNELPITDTDDSAIAADAMIGLNNQPVSGNKTPAASGTPAAL